MRLQPLVLLVLASCAAPAFAQSTAPPATGTTSFAPARQHQPLDTNHDGVITRDEVQSRPGLAKHFDQIDTNRDGKIDRDEFGAFRDRMKSRREQKQSRQAPAAASSSD